MAISGGSDGWENDGFWGGRGRRGGVGSAMSGGGRADDSQNGTALLRQAVEADDERELGRLLAGGGNAGWLIGKAHGALTMAAMWGAPRCAGALAAALPKNADGRALIHGAMEHAVASGHGATFEALASLAGEEEERAWTGIAAAARAKTSAMLALVMAWIGRELVADEVSELLWLCAGGARVEGLRMALALPGADPWALSASREVAMEALTRRRSWDADSRECAELLAEAMALSAGPARMAAMAARMEGLMQGLAGGRGRDEEGPRCFRRISERWVEAGEVGDASQPRSGTKDSRAKAL